MLELGATVCCYLEDDAGGHVFRKGTVTYINRCHGWFLVSVEFNSEIVRQGYRIIEGSAYEPQVRL